ncbi:MAG TPA: carbohydrate binding domain-containing protein [Paludibacter sp.]|nr:carbohydrate binding domain-containing protein [Paludibacter sp.]
MKKITLLLSFIACVVLANAQTNLLTNPGFETWTNGTAPDGWTLGTATYASVSASTSLFNEGSKSFKVTPVATGGGTYIVSQIIPITPGKTYTIKMSYYIETGDGTDARIWSDWCNVVSGSSTTYAALNHADSVLLMGPGGGSAYFPDVKGTWNTYTCEVTAPASGYNSFSFQFRTYKNPAVVYWDNMYFGEKTTGISIPTADILNVSVAGKTLTVTDSPSSTVDIFNTVGAKVKTVELVNGSADLNLAKGLYIVRVGAKSAKIRL